jgi:hypothetical protein
MSCSGVDRRCGRASSRLLTGWPGFAPRALSRNLARQQQKPQKTRRARISIKMMNLILTLASGCRDAGSQ